MSLINFVTAGNCGSILRKQFALEPIALDTQAIPKYFTGISTERDDLVRVWESNRERELLSFQQKAEGEQ